MTFFDRYANIAVGLSVRLPGIEATMKPMFPHVSVSNSGKERGSDAYGVDDGNHPPNIGQRSSIPPSPWLAWPLHSLLLLLDVPERPEIVRVRVVERLESFPVQLPDANLRSIMSIGITLHFLVDVDCRVKSVRSH